MLDQAVDHGPVGGAGAEGRIAVGDRAAQPLHVLFRASAQRLQEIVERGLQELLVPLADRDEAKVAAAIEKFGKSL